MTTPRPARRRDAAATRQALLDAARELFGVRGYDRTTLRDVAERAGVDAALVARYFGGKVDLYLAAIAAEPPLFGPDDDAPLLNRLVQSILRRTDTAGVGPVGRAILQRAVDDEIREAARAHIAQRVLDPLSDRLAARGIEQPRLRAEVVTAALLGIAAARSSGNLTALADAAPDELIPLGSELLTRLTE